MNPTDLAAIGRALTGSDRWRRPLSRMLGVSEGFVRAMERGKERGGRPVPERIARRLEELAAERREELTRISRNLRPGG